MRASTLAVDEAEEERQESREVSDNKEPDLLNQNFRVVDEKMVANLLTTAMEVTKLGAWTTRLPGSEPWLRGRSSSDFTSSPRILPGKADIVLIDKVLLKVKISSTWAECGAVWWIG